MKEIESSKIYVHESPDRAIAPSEEQAICGIIYIGRNPYQDDW